MDLDDTDEEVDAELWSLSNTQSGEEEGDGVGLTIAPFAPGLSLSLSVRHSLIPGMMAQHHDWAPPIVQQQLGALLSAGTGPDCRS